MAGGFAAGFFGTLAEDIGDRQEYVRNRVEEKRDELRQRGLERMGEVNRQRRAYETAARSLMRMSGVNSDRIISALESDPDAIVDAYNRAQSNPNITGSVLNQFFSVYDSTPSSTSLSEAVNNILPMSADVAASRNDPTSAGTATFASLLGLDIDATLNSEVYDSDIVGGMTGAQITASMSQPVTARGTRQDGVQLDYSVFAPENLEGPDLLDIRDFRDFEGGVLDLYRNRADAKIRSLQAELDSVDRSQMSPEQMAQRKGELQEQILKIDEMVTIDDFIEEFEPTILQDQLRLYPEAQRQQLMELYDMPGVSVTEPAATDGVATEIVTPEVTTTDLPGTTPEEEVTEGVTTTDTPDPQIPELRRGIAALTADPSMEEIEIAGTVFNRDDLLDFTLGDFDPSKPEDIQQVRVLFDLYQSVGLPMKVNTVDGLTFPLVDEADFDFFINNFVVGQQGGPTTGAAGGNIQGPLTENERDQMGVPSSGQQQEPFRGTIEEPSSFVTDQETLDYLNVPEFAFVVGQDDPQELIKLVEEEFNRGAPEVELMLEIGGTIRTARLTPEKFEEDKEALLGVRGGR